MLTLSLFMQASKISPGLPADVTCDIISQFAVELQYTDAFMLNFDKRMLEQKQTAGHVLSLQSSLP